MRFYVYKMVVDNGGAPCVLNGELSLAICKPIIRRLAKEQAWIFGFAGDSIAGTHPGNPLIYVARVDRRIPGNKYYADKGPFTLRPDCIYKATSGGFAWRAGAKYHQKELDLDRDLGTQDSGYENACVILSRTFRYFGSDGPRLREEEEALGGLLANLTRGHRVNHDPNVHDALLHLKTRAFSPEWEAHSKLQSPVPSLEDTCNCGDDSGSATNDLDRNEPSVACIPTKQKASC